MDLFEFAKKKEEGEEKGEPEEQVFTVSEITAQVKEVIISRFGFNRFWVKGELSNFKGRNQSGHMYFRLKDSGAVLNCVFFRNANRKVEMELKEGMAVLAFGRLDVWEQGGNYQLIIEDLRPGGTGELYLKFEQLKKKLSEEGLFDPKHKKPLPEFPRRIGIITSPTGAVIRDMIHVIEKRFPFVTLLLLPVKVQGEGAAEEISLAIHELNESSYQLDLLIVGRGGGSIEDLWAFNEEIVARAIFSSHLPIVSAVGHQTDFTISDFVADVRAATPSQAAEIILPDQEEIQKRCKLLMRNILQELLHIKNVQKEKFFGLLRSSLFRDPTLLLRNQIQQVDQLTEQLMKFLQEKKDKSLRRLAKINEGLTLRGTKLLEPLKLQFEKVAGKIEVLNPLAVLGRGFSIVQTKEGKVVVEEAQVSKGEEVSVQLYKGGLSCKVLRTSAKSFKR